MLQDAVRAWQDESVASHSNPPIRVLLFLGCVLMAAAGGASRAGATARQTTSDTLWAQRGEGRNGARAAPEPIAEAIRVYENLVASNPQDMEARWKLLRALHFRGRYVLENEDEKLVVFERGRELADESRALLNALVELDPEEREPSVVAEAVARRLPATVDSQVVAQIYFYSAIHWGLWGEHTGKMKAARQGVAGRIRDYAQTVVLIDARLAEAGGLRFLGRLHTEAPRIPFVTGWIDRQQAVRDLERACQLGPNDPANHVYLADALLRFAKDRDAEAIERLERAAASSPRADHLVEDAAIIAEARDLLAEQR